MSEFNMPQILSDAADHIEKVGFHKGGLFKSQVNPWLTNPESPCCTLGAVAVVTGVNLDSDKWPTLIYKTGEAMGLPDDMEVAYWNDKPSQRKGRVIAALRRASARLKGAQDD